MSTNNKLLTEMSRSDTSVGLSCRKTFIRVSGCISSLGSWIVFVVTGISLCHNEKLSDHFKLYLHFFGRKICVTCSATAKTIKEITKERLEKNAALFILQL